MLRPGLHQLQRAASGVLVAQVSLRGEDAPLELVGVASGLQHVRIVVGFQQHGIRAAHGVHPALLRAAYVRGDGEARAAALEAQAHRLIGVVGRGEGRHVQRAQVEVLSRFHLAAQLRIHRADLALHARPGARRGVDGQAVLAGEHAHAAGVVAVLVGHQDCRQLGWLDADLAQLVGDARAGESGVHQYVGASAAHVDCVSARAAKQR